MKRFYTHVTVEPRGDGWQVLLDGRGVRTAGGREQRVPGKALASALAAEWAGQGDEIAPGGFRLRDFADYAIDIAGQDRAGVVRTLAAYAGIDTLCYRAEPGEPLHARQIALWEPLLARAEQRWDVHFTRVSGIVHQPQPPETQARMEAVLAAHDPFVLAALQTLASLAASLVVALAAIEPGADARALWTATNLEEDWQAELWGKDAEAEALRQSRFALFEAAMEFARLASCPAESA